MRQILLPIAICILSSAVVRAETTSCWVFFKDRGSVNVAKEVAAKAASVSEPKNTSRRARLAAGVLFDERDLPVDPAYVAGVAEITGGIRTVTRWFNGVSVELDNEAKARVERLPFVKSIRPVAKFKGSPEPGRAMKPVAEKPAELSYGASYYQLNTAGIVKLHSRGYFGSGIRICILDSGFDNLGHPAFDSLRVTHTWDFVGRDGDPVGDGHGTEVLSVLAANDPGKMIGAAPGAEYILARTEIINDTDVRAEEDYWVAGLEWADSLGADIVNSSVGYTNFADGTSYSYSDLDGETAITTIAADIAVDKGMTVVVSAGNEADDAWYYIVTPADGKRVIAVGSVRLNDDLTTSVSSFSSRGPTFDGRIKPDFMALGEKVAVVNTAGSTYTYKNGTSYSAPAVSGAAALLLQIHANWSPAVLYDSLRVTAKPAGPDSLAGHGIIDAFAASGLSNGGSVVEGFTVYDPYPQPAVFGGKTAARVYFPVDVPAGGKTLTISIRSFSGEIVRRIESLLPAAGSYRDRNDAPSWDGTNFTGDPVAPGVYFYTVGFAGTAHRSGKIAIIR